LKSVVRMFLLVGHPTVVRDEKFLSNFCNAVTKRGRKISFINTNTCGIVKEKDVARNGYYVYVVVHERM
jgi:hypothetical protein